MQQFDPAVLEKIGEVTDLAAVRDIQQAARVGVEREDRAGPVGDDCTGHGLVACIEYAVVRAHDTISPNHRPVVCSASYGGRKTRCVLAGSMLPLFETCGSGGKGNEHGESARGCRSP